MGLSREAFRLLKSQWEDPQLLAEELYLMLLTDVDATLGPTSVATVGSTDTPTSLSADLATDPFPGLNLGALDFPIAPSNPLDQQQDSTSNANQRTQSTTATYHVRLALPGLVVSGSGGFYTVTLYPNSTQGEDPVTVLVTGVKQLDGSDSTAAGTWVLVFRHTQFEVTTLRTVEDQGDLGEKELSKSTQVRVKARQHEFQPGGGGGGGVPVKITGGGPGDTYTALAYPAGTSSTGVAITVKVLQIDPADTIPVGTWGLASLVAGVYYLQPAVWLNG